MSIKMVIAGGSDAGISAGLRAKELNPKCEVTIVVADRFPNYSICGLPFYLSGEVRDWRALAHRTIEERSGAGLSLLLDQRVQAIDPDNHRVTVIDEGGQARYLPYDRLIIATGATSIHPSIAGLNLPGVFFLRFMADAFAVHQHLETRAPRKAVIIGGGYIGMEMADALTRRGLSVTVVEHAASVLKTIDPGFGKLVGAELQRHDIRVETNVRVERIDTHDTRLRVLGSKQCHTIADLAGDCVETWHRVLNRTTYMPLGSTAHKQGRIAGENAVGVAREFAGTLGTQVVKVFDLVIARTGLRDHEAAQVGYDPFTVESTTWDHKVYYPEAHEVRIRVTGDRKTRRLLGAQMLGNVHSEIAKRIDIFATALFHNMRVEELNDLDLSYTPPLSSPWDPVQMSAQTWVKALQ
jgi:NADPH-dependent 2,4-dienoyl-CoA reductase/sulfur reductase-like enzyme